MLNISFTLAFNFVPGNSALGLAVDSNNVAVAQVLLTLGSDPNGTIQGEKYVIHCATRCRQDLVKVLLEGGSDPNCNTLDGLPLLFFVCAAAAMKEKYGDQSFNVLYSIASLLLEHGADPNAAGPGGYSPLHIAGEVGNLTLIKALLSRGAAPESLTHENKSPAHLAAEWGHLDAVRYLNYGPDNESVQEDLEKFMEEAKERVRQKLETTSNEGTQNIPTPEDPDEAKCRELKGSGNKAFVAGDFDAALKLYQDALKHGTSDSTLWSNAAAAALRLKEYETALKHARISRAIDRKNVKAWYREGQACEGLELWEDAAAAYYEGFLIHEDGEHKSNTIDVDFGHLVKSAVERGRKALHGEPGSADVGPKAD